MPGWLQKIFGAGDKESKGEDKEPKDEAKMPPPPQRIPMNGVQPSPAVPTGTVSTMLRSVASPAPSLAATPNRLSASRPLVPGGRVPPWTDERGGRRDNGAPHYYYYRHEEASQQPAAAAQGGHLHAPASLPTFGRGASAAAAAAAADCATAALASSTAGQQHRRDDGLGLDSPSPLAASAAARGPAFNVRNSRRPVGKMFESPLPPQPNRAGQHSTYDADVPAAPHSEPPRCTVVRRQQVLQQPPRSALAYGGGTTPVRFDYLPRMSALSAAHPAMVTTISYQSREQMEKRQRDRAAALQPMMEWTYQRRRHQTKAQSSRWNSQGRIVSKRRRLATELPAARDHQQQPQNLLPGAARDGPPPSAPTVRRGARRRPAQPPRLDLCRRNANGEAVTVTVWGDKELLRSSPYTTGGDNDSMDIRNPPSVAVDCDGSTAGFKTQPIPADALDSGPIKRRERAAPDNDDARAVVKKSRREGDVPAAPTFRVKDADDPTEGNWGDLFKDQKKVYWKCRACLLPQHDEKAEKCIACTMPRYEWKCESCGTGHEDKESRICNGCGTPRGAGGESTPPQAQPPSTESSSGKASSGFIFGAPPPATPTASGSATEPSQPTAPAFIFAAPTGSSVASVAASAAQQQPAAPAFKFGAPPAPSVGFGITPSAPPPALGLGVSAKSSARRSGTPAARPASGLIFGAPSSGTSNARPPNGTDLVAAPSTSAGFCLAPSSTPDPTKSFQDESSAPVQSKSTNGSSSGIFQFGLAASDSVSETAVSSEKPVWPPPPSSGFSFATQINGNKESEKTSDKDHGSNGNDNALRPQANVQFSFGARQSVPTSTPPPASVTVTVKAATEPARSLGTAERPSKRRPPGDDGAMAKAAVKPFGFDASSSTAPPASSSVGAKATVLPQAPLKIGRDATNDAATTAIGSSFQFTTTRQPEATSSVPSVPFSFGSQAVTTFNTTAPASLFGSKQSGDASAQPSSSLSGPPTGFLFGGSGYANPLSEGISPNTPAAPSVFASSSSAAPSREAGSAFSSGPPQALASAPSAAEDEASGFSADANVATTSGNQTGFGQGPSFGSAPPIPGSVFGATAPTPSSTLPFGSSSTSAPSGSQQQPLPLGSTTAPAPSAPLFGSITSARSPFGASASFGSASSAGSTSQPATQFGYGGQTQQQGSSGGFNFGSSLSASSQPTSGLGPSSTFGFGGAGSGPTPAPAFGGFGGPSVSPSSASSSFGQQQTGASFGGGALAPPGGGFGASSSGGGAPGGFSIGQAPQQRGRRIIRAKRPGGRA
jgi:hypothetical protein